MDQLLISSDGAHNSGHQKRCKSLSMFTGIKIFCEKEQWLSELENGTAKILNFKLQYGRWEESWFKKEKCGWCIWRELRFLGKSNFLNYQKMVTIPCMKIPLATVFHRLELITMLLVYLHFFANFALHFFGMVHCFIYIYFPQITLISFLLSI